MKRGSGSAGVDGNSVDGGGGEHVCAGDNPLEGISAVGRSGGGAVFVSVGVKKIARDNHVAGEGEICSRGVGESQGGDCR